MQFALLIFEDEAGSGKADRTAAFQALVGQHMAFSGELLASGVQTGGAGLAPTAAAVTVRRAGADRTVHDGPFAEAKEQLAGFYIVEAPDRAAAVALAQRMPLSDGGSVEIRALLGRE